jgi:dynein heavy chain
MVFAICWSLGASCDKAGRAVFDSFIRTKYGELCASQPALQQLPADVLMPDSASVYDWCFDNKVKRGRACCS